MKMEVLSVQNQFPVQFGIGSTKGKGWTSPLTPPSHHYSSNNKNIDIVDGRRTKMSSPTAMQQNLNHHHHLQATTKSRTNRETTNCSDIFSIGNIRNGRNINSNISETSNNTTNPTSGSQNNNRYNSNIVCMTDDDDASVNSLSMRLQGELREAKSRHLACTEVSLPFDLTPRIAAEIIKVSEKEPCGIRGCTIYIEFEDEPSNTRRIASMRVDPNTVPTFELYLTLKQDNSGWTSMLPQFIKNLRRSSTILISRDFSLTKNKLYHSSSE